MVYSRNLGATIRGKLKVRAGETTCWIRDRGTCYSCPHGYYWKSDSEEPVSKFFPSQVGECTPNKPAGCSTDSFCIQKDKNKFLCHKAYLGSEGFHPPSVGIEAESTAFLVIPKPPPGQENCYAQAANSPKHTILARQQSESSQGPTGPLSAKFEIDTNNVIYDVLGRHAEYWKFLPQTWTCLNERLRGGFGTNWVELVTDPFYSDDAQLKTMKGLAGNLRAINGKGIIGDLYKEWSGKESISTEQLEPRFEKYLYSALEDMEKNPHRCKCLSAREITWLETNDLNKKDKKLNEAFYYIRGLKDFGRKIPSTISGGLQITLSVPLHRIMSFFHETCQLIGRDTNPKAVAWFRYLDGLDDTIYWPPLKGVLLLLGHYIIRWGGRQEAFRQGVMNMKNGVLDYLSRCSFTSLFSAAKIMYRGHEDRFPFQNGEELYDWLGKYFTTDPTLSEMQMYPPLGDKYVGASSSTSKYVLKRPTPPWSRTLKSWIVQLNFDDVENVNDGLQAFHSSFSTMPAQNRGGANYDAIIEVRSPKPVNVGLDVIPTVIDEFGKAYYNWFRSGDMKRFEAYYKKFSL